MKTEIPEKELRMLLEVNKKLRDWTLSSTAYQNLNQAMLARQASSNLESILSSFGIDKQTIWEGKLK